MGPRLPVSIAFAVLGTGCFGAPWVLPPSRVTIGGGTSTERTHASERRAGQRDGTFALRAAVEPMQLIPEAMDRPLELGVGYELESGPDGSVYGPFGEVGWVLYAGALGPDTRAPRGWGKLRPLASDDACTPEGGCLRLAVRTRLASIRSDDATGGWQIGTQLALEMTGFASGSFGSASGNGRSAAAAGGAAYGEGGIGLYAEGARATLAGQTWWTFTGGLVLRVPVSVGGFFVVCGECAAMAAWR